MIYGFYRCVNAGESLKKLNIKPEEGLYVELLSDYPAYTHR